MRNTGAIRMGLTTEQKRQELRTRIDGTAIQEPVTLHGYTGTDGKTYSANNPDDYKHRSGVTMILYGSREEYEAENPTAKKYYVWN